MTAAPLSLTPPGVSPRDAARAYQTIDRGDDGTGAAGQGSSFGDMLARAAQGAVDAGHAAEAQAMQGIASGGNITEVVQAVSRAELALQTATALRDRMVQAYQDIMKMPI
jgi:flagellar hook-basal body complex protein FliE